jgi:putative heme transporter
VKARIRRYLPAAIGLAIVVGTFAFVLPRIADYGDVWRVIRDLSWQQVMLLVGATALNLATYAPPWQAALPGLGFTRAFFMTQASTASTYIAPGGAAVGMALSYAMLRRWGFRGSDVALAVAVTGVWNQFVMLGFPVIAIALLTLTGGKNALLQTVAVIALVIFVIAAGAFAAGLSFRGIARWLGDLAARVVSWGLRLIRRRPVTWTGESLVAFRNLAVALLGRRWHVITLATLAGQLTVFILFLACLRVLDVSAGEVSFIEAFAAWSLVRLLGSLPITPGGIGIVEVGLTSALVGFGGANAEVVAAVLVYRTLTMVPTLVLGLVAAAVWRRLETKPSEPVATS